MKRSAHARDMKSTTAVKIWFSIMAFYVVHSGIAYGQGLKGAPEGCGRSASQPPPLITGKSDKERWDKFCSVQPKLIGMKFAEVQNVLGYGKTDASKTEL